MKIYKTGSRLLIYSTKFNCCFPVSICLICYNLFQSYIYDFGCNKQTIIILWAASYRHLAAITLQMSRQTNSNKTLFLKIASHRAHLQWQFPTCFFVFASVKQTAECQISEFGCVWKKGVTYSLFIIKLPFSTVYQFLW